MNLIDKYLQRLSPYHREVVNGLNRKNELHSGEITVQSVLGESIVFSNSYYGRSDMGDLYVLTNLGYFIFQENDKFIVN